MGSSIGSAAVRRYLEETLKRRNRLKLKSSEVSSKHLHIASYRLLCSSFSIPFRNLFWLLPRSQLQRLMDVMAHQRLGNPPHEDEVRLRRAPGRMVIDVHFRSGKASELSGCVVEILNAYAPLGRQAYEVLQDKMSHTMEGWQ